MAHVRNELEQPFSLPSYLPRLQMAYDASGSWGCGASHRHCWFQLQWDSRSSHLPIHGEGAPPDRPGEFGLGTHVGQLPGRLPLRQSGYRGMFALPRELSSPRYAHAIVRTLAFIEARYTFTLTILTPSLTICWASRRWLQLFSATSGTGSPPLPGALMTRP